MTRRGVIEALLAALGISLILVALAASQSWWDRHFLPMLAVQRSTVLAEERAARGLIGLAGVALALIFRRRVAAPLSRATISGAARVLLGVSLGLAAGELMLHTHPPYTNHPDPLEREPRRSSDPWLGWNFAPARSVVAKQAGRSVSYSFDAAGHRVSAPGVTVDFERPTLIFTGESIMAGFGLPWEETIPARVGALLNVQSANLAVLNYSNDQCYLRLAAELPRFRKPVAVVTLFMPGLFDRNLLDDRPRLSARMVWLPPAQHWRLTWLLRWLIPYHGTAAVEQGIAQTRASLRALVDLSFARGAQPLIVVPQFGPESPNEQMLRRRILDDAGLPYVRVELDPSWRLPGDVHPDRRGARAIATAIAARLQDAEGVYKDGRSSISPHGSQLLSTDVLVRRDIQLTVRERRLTARRPRQTKPASESDAAVY